MRQPQSNIHQMTLMISEGDVAAAGAYAQYRHVHHAKIVALLEQGRDALMSACGFSSLTLIEKGMLPVVRSLSIDYLREVQIGAVILETHVAQVTIREIVFAQVLRNPLGKPLATAEVRCMLIPKERGRALRVPVELVGVLQPSLRSSEDVT